MRACGRSFVPLGCTSQQPFLLGIAELAWHDKAIPFKGVRAHICLLTGRTGQEVDGLLGKWDAAYANLLRAEWRYERSGCSKRPRHRTGCCGCSGVPLTPYI